MIPYDMPQNWSRAIHRHPLQVHGILYMSRHVNDHKAVVLFDRASKRLRAAKYQPLPDALGAARAKASLRIKFDYR